MRSASSTTKSGRLSVSMELRGGGCGMQDSNNTAVQTVLTNVQLDPGSAEFLQPVISNLTNITMLTSTLAVRCCPVPICLCVQGSFHLCFALPGVHSQLSPVELPWESLEVLVKSGSLASCNKASSGAHGSYQD